MLLANYRPSSSSYDYHPPSHRLQSTTKSQYTSMLGAVIGILLAFIAIAYIVVLKSDINRAEQQFKTTYTQAEILTSKYNTAQYELLSHQPLSNIQHIIVMYVNQRPQFFAQSLSSLRQVHGINDCLLVISHDSYVEEMEQLVIQARNFTHVVQLYHPQFSLHPSIIQLKSHWYWIVQEVFERIVPTVGANSPWVIFLEEDLVVSPDLLLTTSGMLSHLPRICPHCWGISLYSTWKRKEEQRDTDLNLIHIVLGFPSLAFVVDYRWYKALQAQIEAFHACKDGYDMSVVHMLKQGVLPSAYFQPHISRVKHIGRIGLNMDEDKHRNLGFEWIRHAQDIYGEKIWQVDWKQPQLEFDAHTNNVLQEESELYKMEHQQSSIDSTSTTVLPPHSIHIRKQTKHIHFGGRC